MSPARSYDVNRVIANFITQNHRFTKPIEFTFIGYLPPNETSLINNLLIAYICKSNI